MAPRELRQMSKVFYGAGCPHPGVECFMQKIQKLQAHYGCDSNLGLKMSVSIEMLIVELGVLVRHFNNRLRSTKTGWRGAGWCMFGENVTCLRL